MPDRVVRRPSGTTSHRMTRSLWTVSPIGAALARPSPRSWKSRAFDIPPFFFFFFSNGGETPSEGVG